MVDHLRHFQFMIQLRHRVDKEFQVNHWVYVELCPYRQYYVANRTSQKLAKHYFGPFKIIQRIGTVAYKLDLPVESRIHTVFHNSVFKFCPSPSTAIQAELSLETSVHHVSLTPAHVLDYRSVKINNQLVPQALIQRTHQTPQEATWEAVTDLQSRFPNLNLEDKVVSEARDNDTCGKRIITRPSWVDDYVI